jgi:hypothetical protein
MNNFPMLPRKRREHHNENESGNQFGGMSKS